MEINEFNEIKAKTLRKNLEAVVFDMDGLIFNTEWIIKYSWDIVGKEMGFENFGDNIFNTLGMNHNQRKEYFREKYGEEFEFDKFTERYREVSSLYMEKNGIPIKKGLKNILEYLKNNKIKMAVATSSSRAFAMDKIKKVGIEKYFDIIICGDMVTKSKPDPQIYIKACDELKVNYNNCIAFEDSPKGIIAADLAGMNPIMIPDLIKNAPSEVEEILLAKFESSDEAIDFIENKII
ncbi:HAD family hydrolase [Peptacetobacter sp.]|uniref:HAD family hydrolase n=1 Tax=Peptacetobacter sp. TaxID=2991975 RepID=UPI0026049D5B|nr:HAD family phosphatase [Peptacetobacter sp.]